MRTTTGLAAAVLAIAGFALAEETGKSYRFGMHDKYTNVTFTSETEIETILGTTHTVNGGTGLDFDGLKGRCDLSVPVDSLRTGVDKRDEHLRSDAWLDAAKYPRITFRSDGFDLVPKDKDKGVYEAKVKGDLTIHGVTRALETTVRVVRLSDELNAKVGKGEWVRVSCGFDVTIADFGVVVPDGLVKAKVSPTWTVKFNCFASTANPEEK